jgi:predicted transcriptional regulator YheO
MSTDKTGASYEVLSPWAEAAPKPLKGISPRLADLAGRKIGLLCNNKRAAPIILNVVERILKERYPSSEISWFYSRTFSASSLEPDRKEEFEDWIKGVDAVVAAVGD